LIKYNNISEDKAASYKQSWALAYKFADELESEIGISKKILARMIQGAVYQSYDQKSAEKNLKFINLDNIPKLDESGLSLTGISNIKFTSNLDFSEEIDSDKIKTQAKIFKNMII